MQEERLYCEQCYRLEPMGTEICPVCGGALREAVEGDSVFLVTVEIDAFQQLEGALQQAKIPFQTKDKPLPPDGSVYSGRGLLTPKDVFVRASDYENADRILNGLFTRAAQEENEMPIKKRVLVQVVSVFLFIAVIALVVYAADWIAAFVKSLF